MFYWFILTMENKKLIPVANWGLYPSIKANVVSPTTILEFQEAILSNEEVIARGNGRCYGDASLQNTIISTSKWNKFIDFDREHGIIEVESGVLLSDILEVSIPAGYFISVTPS